MTGLELLQILRERLPSADVGTCVQSERNE
ncbi:MAG: hypothetical protein M3Q89_02880 [Verrucomicrobiota bacterium]|nr:hypothetical protein [Verrucomicrobiota bacterium]